MENIPKYNSKQELILPEYGRNIQNLVKYAVTIEDKEERTKCANEIIRVMGTLFPYLRNRADFKHKLWDHLAILSDFKLDIDYPYEVVTKENVNPKPVRVPYSDRKPRYKHYGKNIENFITAATDMDDKFLSQKEPHRAQQRECLGQKSDRRHPTSIEKQARGKRRSLVPERRGVS